MHVCCLGLPLSFCTPHAAMLRHLGIRLWESIAYPIMLPAPHSPSGDSLASSNVSGSTSTSACASLNQKLAAVDSSRMAAAAMRGNQQLALVRKTTAAPPPPQCGAWPSFVVAPTVERRVPAPSKQAQALLVTCMPHCRSTRGALLRPDTATPAPSALTGRPQRQRARGRSRGREL
jgi:hypothetical protein